LQKELRSADQEALQASSVRFFGAEIQDFSDTAALCDLVDLVISVDTSVAHLAGALGKPTWVLLPYAPDWRWMLDRDDSPWYPSVKLYRQDRDRSWTPVLERVASGLDGESWTP
jgi:ADP-heptose:LPS heptosyltransferase